MRYGILRHRDKLKIKIRRNRVLSSVADPDPYSIDPDPQHCILHLSMGCKAKLIRIIHKFCLFFIKDHLGHCQLYPIPVYLYFYSNIKLTGMEK